MDQWGELTSLSWLHDVKILPNVEHQYASEKRNEENAPPGSTLKQLLTGQDKGNAPPTLSGPEPFSTHTKLISTAVNINFSQPLQSKIVAKKSKAVSSSANKHSSQLTTKDCQQLLFRILNDKRNTLNKRIEPEDETEDLNEKDASDAEEEEELDKLDKEEDDLIKRRRKEEANLFRSLSDEAKKQILTKKIQIQSKTSVRSLCLHFSSLTKVNIMTKLSLPC